MSYQSKHTGTAIDNAITDMQSLQSIILNTVYPVGSLYTSFNSTNPTNIVGGTWVQIENCFLMAAGSSYAIGTSGGSATHTHTSAAHTHTTAGHTLTEAEMPKHRHTPANYDTAGSDTSYKRQFMTALNLSSDSTRRSQIATGSSGIYTIGATTSGDLTNSSTTSYVGGSASHSHGNTGSTTPGATGASSSLPPYKTIYMWQRTA